MMTRAAGRLALAFLAGVAVAGCRGEASPEADAPEAGPVADSAAPEEAARAAATPYLAALIDDGSADLVFPHGPHKDRACTSCHRAIPGHVTHPGTACVDCHTRPPSYASIPPPASQECLECHHRTEMRGDCLACHTVRELNPGRVARAFTLSVWSAPRERSLPFDHRLHEGETCGTCHEPTVFQSPERACGSCHEAHHRPDAACAGCHARPDSAAVHSGDAHTGCAGSGCHDAVKTAGLTASRPLCLICHEAQTRHEVGQDCVGCHQVAPASLSEDGREP